MLLSVKNSKSSLAILVNKTIVNRFEFEVKSTLLILNAFIVSNLYFIKI